MARHEEHLERAEDACKLIREWDWTGSRERNEQHDLPELVRLVRRLVRACADLRVWAVHVEHVDESLRDTLAFMGKYTQAIKKGGPELRGALWMPQVKASTPLVKVIRPWLELLEKLGKGSEQEALDLLLIEYRFPPRLSMGIKAAAQVLLATAQSRPPEPDDLAKAPGKVLNALPRGGYLPARRVAEITGVHYDTVRKILSNLKKSGLVERSPRKGVGYRRL